MCTHDLCFEKNKKHITTFHLKESISSAAKNLLKSILHTRHVILTPQIQEDG